MVLPRAQAAWELHDNATWLADYALCMVGPMGPDLVRDNDPALMDLMRRRLLTSEAHAQPFARCGELARKLSSGRENPALAAEAASFAEFAQPLAETPHSLEQLAIDRSLLQRNYAAAWPFERRGFMHLIRASSHAKEAAHPVEFPQAGISNGLPGGLSRYRTSWSVLGKDLISVGNGAGFLLFESRNGGFSWARTHLNQPGVEQHAGRCMAADAAHSFLFTPDPEGTQVQSMTGDRVVHAARLHSSATIVSSSCDATAAVLRVELGAEDAVVVCEHGVGCAALPLDESWLSNFDVARIEGVTVLASHHEGVVRTRSSRDNGSSWTPATIAFDRLSQRTTPEIAAPTRLLTLGSRLFLFGAGTGRESYPVLVSNDYGASWQAPTQATPSPRATAVQPSSVAQQSSGDGLATAQTGQERQ